MLIWIVCKYLGPYDFIQTFLSEHHKNNSILPVCLLFISVAWYSIFKGKYLTQSSLWPLIILTLLHISSKFGLLSIPSIFKMIQHCDNIHLVTFSSSLKQLKMCKSNSHHEDFEKLQLDNVQNDADGMNRYLHCELIWTNCSQLIGSW